MGFDVQDLLPPQLGLPAYSTDTICKKVEVRLIEFCITHSLITLNGQLQFPLSTNFTFVSTRGCSVIDYGLCFYNLLPLIKSVNIECRTESDHLPLSFLLNFSIKTSNSPNSLLEENEVQILTRIKWSESSENELFNILHSDLLSKLKELIISSSSHEEVLTALSYKAM